MTAKTTKKLTQPIKWHGGKHYLADWIIGHMPPHKHFVEPYFGGGSVLLRKDPEGVSEVANDISGELANFWTVIRSEILYPEFKKIVDLTPFSEEFFDVSGRMIGATVQEAMETADSLAMIDAAWMFFVRARQSRQGLMEDFATLSRNRTRRGMNEQVSSWLTAIDGLPEVHERMKRVVVLNRPALDVIKSQDGPNTLFYLDPPYLHSTRVTTADYKHEMSLDDHVRLLNALIDIQGRFIVSGYPSKTYDAVSRDVGWFTSDREIDNKASSKKIKDKKIERLWMNFDPKEYMGV